MRTHSTHGAGRRISRGEANRTLSQRQMDDEYREAGILVNTDGRVPLDEAAPCYKPSEEVVVAVAPLEQSVRAEAIDQPAGRGFGHLQRLGDHTLGGARMARA